MDKQNKNGTLVSFRPGIKVVDCTMRDGGLVNNFGFSDEFVKALYQANIKAGVDYMEFGYKASREIFDESEFGKWKFSKEEDLRAIVGDNDSNLKISVMADAGRTNYREDIIPKSESVIDMIRVATYIHQIPTAIHMIEDAKEKGYEVTVNVMAASKIPDESLFDGLWLLAKSNVDVIYLVDSFGSFYPEQISRLTAKYQELAEGKEIGFHGHNNQQLAFANTIEACRLGVNYLDASVSGMGRGSGNCHMEALLSFLRNPNYQLFPILKFVEDHMIKLRQEGWQWGYDIAYLLTGVLNNHPSSAIKFGKDKRVDYHRFYQELLEMD
ncbi:MAG: aldolase catalytic domain-containing protein [Lachnospiraceae bacterium]|nr:aldolase catalytic domain-containing protein [Lachnospiraceae bacterium]